jgi:hypothetical protein
MKGWDKATKWGIVAVWAVVMFMCPSCFSTNRMFEGDALERAVWKVEIGPSLPDAKVLNKLEPEALKEVLLAAFAAGPGSGLCNLWLDWNFSQGSEASPETTTQAELNATIRDLIGKMSTP